MSEQEPESGRTLRIAHFLARCGVASRRKCEGFVTAGRVQVNGAVAMDLGRQIDPLSDAVLLDGKPLELARTHLTIAMNKPPRVMVTRTDPEGRRTVYDLLPIPLVPRASELIYCGRLDYMTSGLLILTTDGDLANRLTHPRHHVEKEYRVLVERPLTEPELEKLRDGVELEEGRTQPCIVRLHRSQPEGWEYDVIIREGRNRQVRRMFDVVTVRVLELSRTRVGRLSLRSMKLAQGTVAELSAEQVARLTGS